MDPVAQRLAALESISKVQRQKHRCTGTPLVVGCQQLESARGQKYKAGEEYVGGECRLSECSTPSIIITKSRGTDCKLQYYKGEFSSAA